MKKWIRNTYWLLFAAAAVLLLTVGLWSGTSYASVRSEAVWHTGLHTSPVKVSSTYLKAEGQTVLLNNLIQKRTVGLMLTSNRGTVNGTLHYTVSPKNAVSVQIPETVNATQDGTQVDMVLTPNVVAQDTEVMLSLKWTSETGEILRGDYRFTVPGQAIIPTDTQTKQDTVSNAKLTVMEQFAPGAAVAVTVRHPSQNEKIVLSMAGNHFPAGTRYSTEDSLQETILYDPAMIQMQTTGQETTMFVTLPTGAVSEAFTIQAKLIGSDYETQLQAQTTPIAGTLELPDSYLYKLSNGDSFTLALPSGWKGCTLSYTVQLLTQTKQGIAYKTVANTGSNGLSVVSGTDGITVSLNGTALQAGTYQLVLVWNYQTYTVAQREVTFHVSYPERSTAQTGGKAT